MAAHNDFGKRGELYVQNYLREKGYHLLSTNWVSGKNELDIVAEQQQTLVFVEVKSRSDKNFTTPAEMISRSKIRRIVEAANDYVVQFEIDKEVRFDVVFVFKNKNGSLDIEHIEDAFCSGL